MKRLARLCILLALIGGLSGPARAEKSTDRFVEIYFRIQAGDTARNRRDVGAAAIQYRVALELLREIKASQPDWHPQIVDYRIKYCTQQLQVLGAPPPAAPVAPAPPPPVTVPRPVAVPPPPALRPVPVPGTDRLQQLNAELQQARARIGELQQVREELAAQLAGGGAAQQAREQLAELRTINAGLTAKLERAQAAATKAAVMATELQQAQETIRQLETNRTELNTRLQAALGTMASTQTNPQVEELFNKNAELTAQLAAAQNKITDLSARADTAAAATAGQIQLRAELVRVRLDLEQFQAENRTLTSSRAEARAQLVEAERQLRSLRVAAGKNDELIARLRRENTVMRELIQGLPTRGRYSNGDVETANSHELRNWRPRRPVTTTISESARAKLVATLRAPAAEPAGDTPPPAPPPAKPASTSPVTDAAKETAAPPVAPVPSAETATLLAEAQADLAAKKWDAAAAKCEQVLARVPDQMQALASLAVIRYQQGRFDEAETVLRKTVATQPNDSAARSMMGAIHFRNGRIEEAYHELTRAVALNPRNAEAHNYLGIVMNEKGWPTAAEQEIRRAIELNPRYADAHFNLAVLFARQRTPRPELVRYHYQQALDFGAARDARLDALLKEAGKDATKQPK